MRAVELRGTGYDALAFVERPDPEPGPGEALVRVRAVSLNSRDLQIVHGSYGAVSLPLVPVSDGAGEVVAIGPGVTRVAVGDRVAGIFAQRWLGGRKTDATWDSSLAGTHDGLLRELAVLHEDGLVHVPAHLGFEEAATLPVAGVTAWEALVGMGGLTAGQSVIAQGTGGVSLFAVQIAAAAGCTVIVTSSSDEKLERALALGAHHGVNYVTEPDWDRRALELTGGAGVDHVVEVAGDLDRSLRALRIGGTISMVGYLGRLRLGEPVSLAMSAEFGWVLAKNARIHGITAGSREAFEDLNRALAASAIRPPVDRVFPFEESVEAMRYLESGQPFGKVCIRVA